MHDRYSGLNNSVNWLNLCNRISNSDFSFKFLTGSHFLFNSMLNPFLLNSILNFLFDSLLGDIISLSLIANFGYIFDLMVNYLILCYIFVNWNSYFFLKLVIFSHNLLIWNILKPTLAFHHFA